MSYHINKIIEAKDIQTAKTNVTEALKSEGFGILTEIDIQATMKNKLDKDYPPFLILGACNPQFADQILSIDPNMSALLPCNVTLRGKENGEIEVSAIDPVAAIASIGGNKIESLAKEVKEKLERALATL
ncbi:hypothetical protein A33Q_3618 [Indibacter alkaliphilus LW1]|uniref:DUF302 domain-containing protein n=1 Tax=Indibacter alkaliphilus (strain CCUG 57479 / KCTC 22604 / LW1) TaxID=1189612 RepID=S2D2Z1_INDAL|nr:DUF302 domain-containing protein [Indibacter alkaliphilus]EOZ93672.1 hypothetical protein A33Q_3618 [Indibacter alkaliphilus LW1]